MFNKGIIILCEFVVVQSLTNLCEPERVVVEVVDGEEYVAEHLVGVAEVVYVRARVPLRARMARAPREYHPVVLCERDVVQVHLVRVLAARPKCASVIIAINRKN